MRLLPDTHILLWTIAESRRLSAAARALIGEPDNELTFSSVSLSEVAIRQGEAVMISASTSVRFVEAFSTMVMPNSL